MKSLPGPARRKRRTAVDAVLLLVVTMLIVQMWLLTATVESSLAGHHTIALPAFLASLVLFLASFGLYRMVVRLDRAAGPEDLPPASPSGPWQI